MPRRGGVAGARHAAPSAGDDGACGVLSLRQRLKLDNDSDARYQGVWQEENRLSERPGGL